MKGHKHKKQQPTKSGLYVCTVHRGRGAAANSIPNVPVEAIVRGGQVRWLLGDGEIVTKWRARNGN